MDEKGIQQLDEDTFDEAVSTSTRPILVDFRADWCRPCRLLEPVLEALAAEFAGRARFGRVDVDEAGDLANRFGVRFVPTLILFAGGRVVDQLVGAAPVEEIRALLVRRLR